MNSKTATFIPRLRQLIESGRFNRSQVCLCLDRHPNALQRLDDPSWHPRLDTIEAIETFLEHAADPKFRVFGPGWRLSRPNEGEWVIIRGRCFVLLGPYSDPYKALSAAEKKRPNLSAETNLEALVAAGGQHRLEPALAEGEGA